MQPTLITSCAPVASPAPGDLARARSPPQQPFFLPPRPLTWCVFITVPNCRWPPAPPAAAAAFALVRRVHGASTSRVRLTCPVQWIPYARSTRPLQIDARGVNAPGTVDSTPAPALCSQLQTSGGRCFSARDPRLTLDVHCPVHCTFFVLLSARVGGTVLVSGEHVCAMGCVLRPPLLE
jgi:hypothetical protein